MLMGNFLSPDRTIDLYIAKPLAIYQPLAAVICYDFKGTPSQVQTYTLDSNDEIPPEVNELLTQKGVQKGS